MSWTFVIVGTPRQFRDYYDQDLDRVERSSSDSLSGSEYTWLVPQPGGLYLGLEDLQLATYEAAPVSRSGVKRDDALAVSRVDLSVGLSIPLQKALAANPKLLINAEVLIRRTFEGLPNDYPDSYRQVFGGTVTSFVAAENGTLEVEVSDRWFDWSSNVTTRTYQKLCGFRFASGRCQYLGAGVECDKTLPQCITYANEIHFGGFDQILDVRFKGWSV